MASYYQIIEGYQSPDQSDHENLLIDYCNPAPLPPPSQATRSTQPRPRAEEFRPRNSQISIPASRRDYYNNSGKKAYTFLSQAEMEQFQADLLRGELTKQELCQKYKVSISTTARFIRNLKEYGQLNVKKTKMACNELMNKMILQYPNLSFAQIKKKIAEQAHHMSSQRQYELAATNKYK